MKLILIISGLFFLSSCQHINNNSDHLHHAPDNHTADIDIADKSSLSATKQDKLIAKTIEAHGGSKYKQAHYSFVFRDKIYEFKNDGKNYLYKVTSKKDSTTIIDEINNNEFRRTIDGKQISLSEEDESKFSNALNSVIYFATLPYKLEDIAVNKFYVGTQTIKDKIYEVVKITFNKDGGGTDHDDTFHYWINTDDNLIDYLAYNYTVNNGGVRLRTAQNRRIVDGIVFQDYINYKAEVGTPLADLTKLWEEGSLKELSKIKTKNIQKL